MRKLSKRIIGFSIAAAMAFSTIPSTVFAAAEISGKDTVSLMSDETITQMAITN